MYWINSCMQENDNDEDKDDAMMRMKALMNEKDVLYEMIKA